MFLCTEAIESESPMIAYEHEHISKEAPFLISSPSKRQTQICYDFLSKLSLLQTPLCILGTLGHIQPGAVCEIGLQVRHIPKSKAIRRLVQLVRPSEECL